MNTYITPMFLQIVQISLQAAYVVIGVLIVRFVFQKIHALQRMKCWLWYFPFIRLIVPVYPKSGFSFIPKGIAEPGRIEALSSEIPLLFSNIENGDVTSYTEAVVQGGMDNVKEIVLVTLAVLWVVGMVGFLFYGIVATIHLKKQLVYQVKEENNICQVDNIPSAFVLGIRYPKIYIPSTMADERKPYVILHEKMHIKRNDHLLKIVAFLACTVYWFQPLAWVMYYFLCKDMELACDEAVIHEIGEENCKVYAEALLELSLFTKKIGPFPLTFTESSPKGRIQSIMSYKRPKRRAYVVCGILFFVLSVGFLTNPKAASIRGYQETMGEEKGSVPSYELRSGESITVSSDRADGKRKTSYVVFEVKRRGKVTVMISQEYKDVDAVQGLLADDIENTYISLQKRQKDSWIQVSEAFSSRGERGTLEYEETDEEGKVIGDAIYCDYVDGGCGMQYMLSEGTYRYVIESGFPSMKVSHNISYYDEPGLSKEQAVEIKEEEEFSAWFGIFGLFVMTDEASHWYKFRMNEKRVMEVNISEWECTTDCTAAIAHLYDERGTEIWNCNLWEHENYDFGGQTVCTLKEGIYYIELEPKELNSGVNYHIQVSPKK